MDKDSRPIRLAINILDAIFRLTLPLRESPFLRRLNFEEDPMRRACDPCVPNPVIAPNSAEKSSVLASYERSYFRSLPT